MIRVLKMKKLVCLLLAAAFLVMCGCGEKVEKNSVFSPDDLPGKTIGVISGTSAGFFAKEYQQSGAFLREYTSAEAAAAELKSGLTDCLIIDRSQAKKLTDGLSGLKILDTAFLSAGFAIAVARENFDLTEDINSAINALYSNGTIKKIVDGYINSGNYRYTPQEGAEPPEDTLTLAVADGIVPYAYVDELTGEIVGIDVDVARAICDHIGIGLEIKTAEAEELIDIVRGGLADFVMGAVIPNEEELDRVDFTEVYTEIDLVMVVRKK